MRAIEAAAIESGAVTGLALMERAGEGVVAALLAEWPELAAGAQAVVLCGPGNNGGDGYVIARLLADRGWTVRLLACGDPDRLPPDAAENARRWRAIGAIERQAGLSRLDSLMGEGGDPRHPAPLVVIDAVFGIGLSRPPTGEAADLLKLLAEARRAGAAGSVPVHVVAVDVPSGLDADSGAAPGLCERADLTVTFHRAKPGHLRGLGPELCGKLVVADIGLPA